MININSVSINFLQGVLVRDISRRQLLSSTSGFAVLATIPAKKLFAATNKYQEQIDTFVGGNKLSEGQLELDLPEIAENGNTVPVAVSAPGAVAITMLAGGNPTPGVAKFTFGPGSAEQSASTRIRLAGTQDVIAIAEMADGSFAAVHKRVKVTIGGCGG